MAIPLIFVAELAELCPTQYTIGRILRVARLNEDVEPVAYHLVGAFFSIRYDYDRNVKRRWAARKSCDGADYWLGKTSFYISAKLNRTLFKRIDSDVSNEARIYLLTPEFRLNVAHKRTAENCLTDRIEVQSIQSFIGILLDNMSRHIPSQVQDNCEKLIDAYNARISAVETGDRLQIFRATSYDLY